MSVKTRLMLYSFLLRVVLHTQYTCLKISLCIGGSKGVCAPWGPISFIFLQVSGKIDQLIAFHAPPPQGNPGTATALCPLYGITTKNSKSSVLNC